MFLSVMTKDEREESKPEEIVLVVRVAGLGRELLEINFRLLTLGGVLFG